MAKSDLQFDFTAVPGDTDERYYFAAAALTVGFELAENTPQISNTYDIHHKYEPGEPGDIRYYLPTSKGPMFIEEFVQTWLDADTALRQAETLPARILGVTDGTSLSEVVNAFDYLYVHAAVAHMRLMSLSRMRLPDINPVSAEEAEAVNQLDHFSKALREANTKAVRVQLARKLGLHWRPAMIAWLKAFRTNYLELRNLWRHSPESLKIQRDGGTPIILHKGPEFKKLLERWT